MSTLRFAILSLLAFAFAACSRPAPRLPGEPLRTDEWSAECLEDLAAVPVQENGRVKPLSVLAAFTLYKVHGRRDLKFSVPGPDGSQQKVTLTPIEWVLDTFCYPGQAIDYPLFRIENVQVLDALGFANDGQKQGFEWLSYRQLTAEGVVQELQKLAQSAIRIEQADRTAVQEHLVQLWGRLIAYDELFSLLDPFRVPVDVASEPMREALGGERVLLGDLLARGDAFRSVFRTAGPDVEKDEALNSLAFYLQKVIEYDNGGPRMLPPADPATEAWLRTGAGVDRVLRDEQGRERTLLDALVGLQLGVAGKSHAQKETGLRQYAAAIDVLAGPRDDVGPVQLETDYYATPWHYQALHWFLFAFVLAAVCWLAPRSRLLWSLSMGVAVLAFGMLSYDLVLRCIITGRPPIKNLYDTFLFIAWTGVLIGVVTEFVLPRRIALAAAPLFGALMIMFARMFEVSNAADTMDPLQAVLDSNFWLATHVTSINIGYGAGLFAALLANVWIFARALRIWHPEQASAKALVRMTYGVTCFALMFSVVGTILGGVWANDSWGRFWGWDPKENGALMICLSQIALLHARMSGWVRDFGFIVWSVATGMVVVFSWFHVNLLGIGLHSYGFSSGLRTAVWTCYMVQLGTLLVGTVDWMLRPNPARVERAPAADAAWPAAN